MRNKTYGLLAGVICLISFTAEAEKIKFSDYNDLTKKDRYIVVIGSKPSNARPRIIKQVHFDSIDTNITQEVLDKSEGAYINVKELMKDDSAELVGKIYQAYQMKTILFFDAHKKKKQTRFRNNFLSNHFNHPKSSARFVSVYSNLDRTIEEKLNVFFRSSKLNPENVSNDFSAAQMSITQSSKAACDGLTTAATITDLMDVDYNAIDGVRSSISSNSASVSSMMLPIPVIIAGVDAIVKTSAYFACLNIEDDTLSKEDVLELAKEQVDKNTFAVINRKLKVLAYSMTESINEKLLGSDASLNSQKNWVGNILREIDQMYPMLDLLGIQGSSMTALIAATDIALLNFYYKIHEQASKKEQRYALNFITDRLRKTLDPFKLLDINREEFLKSMEVHNNKRKWPSPNYDTAWGVCTEKKNDLLCYRGKIIRGESKATQYSKANLKVLKNRYQKPRTLKAVQEYAEYMDTSVKKMRKKSTFISFKQLGKNFKGYKLKNTVSLHGKANQKGWEVDFGLGQYDFLTLQAMGVVKGGIKSISVPPGLIIRAYSDKKTKRWPVAFAGDANSIDEFNSMVVGRIKKTVSIFQNNNQNKTERNDMEGVVVTEGAEVRLAVGHYNKAQLKARGMTSWTMSSIKVPRGLKATLSYRKRGHTQWKTRVNSDGDLKGKFNNNVTDIHVEYDNLKEYNRIRNERNIPYGLCLDTTFLSGQERAIGYSCSKRSTDQRWKYNTNSKQLSNYSGKCLTLVPIDRGERRGRRIILNSVQLKKCLHIRNNKWKGKSQQWTFEDQQIHNDSHHGCLHLSESKHKTQGMRSAVIPPNRQDRRSAALNYNRCIENNVGQRWYLENFRTKEMHLPAPRPIRTQPKRRR